MKTNVIATDAQLARQKLKQRQSLPLEAKIRMTEQRIRDWVDHWDGDVYQSHSGGKDSTVLRHIIRSMGYTDIPALFSNTGLEYPEIVKFVKEQQALDANIVIIRPKVTFRESLLTEGFPLISKKVAMMVERMRNMVPSDKNINTRRLYMTGVKRDGSTNKASMIPLKWQSLVTAPFKTTQKCCDTLKKEPFKRYEKETGRKPMGAVMVQEGGARGVLHTCNTFEGTTVISYPMLFWTEADVWEYLTKYNVAYASCYDDYVLEDGSVMPGEVRTGCMFCAYGAHLESDRNGMNRFQRMYYTHPKQWNYCINKLNMREAFDFIGLAYLPEGVVEK